MLGTSINQFPLHSLVPVYIQYCLPVCLVRFICQSVLSVLSASLSCLFWLPVCLVCFDCQSVLSVLSASLSCLFCLPVCFDCLSVLSSSLSCLFRLRCYSLMRLVCLHVCLPVSRSVHQFACRSLCLPAGVKIAWFGVCIVVVSFYSQASEPARLLA